MIVTTQEDRQGEDTQYKKCCHAEQRKQNKADQVGVESRSKNRDKPLKKKKKILPTTAYLEKGNIKMNQLFKKHSGKYTHKCPVSYIN